MNEMIMVSNSLNNNTRTGFVISFCLNANTLVSLIPPNRLKLWTCKVHSLTFRKVAATPVIKSVPSQFSPFIL